LRAGRQIMAGKALERMFIDTLPAVKVLEIPCYFKFQFQASGFIKRI